MPILLELVFATMLSKFLEDQFLKRRGVELYIDLTDWAKEIGIPYNTLRGMMRNKSKDPSINSKNLAKLIKYFGPPVLEAIGSSIPDKPTNPMYSPLMATGSSVSEKRDQSYGSKKEGK